MFVSKKMYSPERGYSIAYRQWRADSHCRLIHGYAIGIEITFQSPVVDARNWVVDFGSLKEFKSFLDDHFDHTMLVASDDPEIATFKQLHEKGMCKLVEVERTGCEGLADFLCEYLNTLWIPDHYPNTGVRCTEIIIHETLGANSGGVTYSYDEVGKKYGMSDLEFPA